jgi:DNA-binding NarL/FixJ family response regulator
MHSPLNRPHGEGRTGKKVLIVEDEFLVSMQIEDILIDNGYEVVGTVADMASLSQITVPPDVALVDLNLRDGPTGPQIAEMLSAKFGTRVVYVTANPCQIETPAPTAIGILPKPFSRDSITAALTYAVEGGDTPPHELLLLS